MRFPAPRNSFPTKDEMADYLEAYAARFRLPVRNGVRVERLCKRGARFVVKAGASRAGGRPSRGGDGELSAPRSGPPSPLSSSSEIVQMHSYDYRNLAQLRPGGVLIVGAGNSGAELAMESRARRSSNVDVGQRTSVTFRFAPNEFFGRNLLAPLVLRFVFHRLLTVRTPIGRKARPKISASGGSV